MLFWIVTAPAVPKLLLSQIPIGTGVYCVARHHHGISGWARVIAVDLNSAAHALEDVVADGPVAIVFKADAETVTHAGLARYIAHEIVFNVDAIVETRRTLDVDALEL